MVEPLSLNFRVLTVKLVGVGKFRNFTVFSSCSRRIDKARVFFFRFTDPPDPIF